jgi:hypothetical protein
MALYGQKAVDSFVNEKLIPNGYEINVLEDCLVDGYVCIPPSEKQYWFIFLPHYLNEWSSALEMHRYRSWETVPKKIKATIKLFEDFEETA